MEHQFRVVIIGAGIAGLSCAKYLIENGIDDFVILEAHDQIGGRCQTMQLLDHQLELGAESLHGEISNNPLYRLAEEHHLIDIDDRGSDRDDCYHDEEAESIDEDVIDEVRKVYDEILEKKVAAYPYENYPDISLGEFVSAEIEQYINIKKVILDKDELDEQQKVIDWLSKQHPYLNTIGCNKLTDVSVQGWNSLERLPSNNQYNDEAVYMYGGFSNFLQTVFADQLNENQIELNTIVKRVSIREEEQYVDIEIIKNNQELITTYQAKHVVCTQSVGCLKQSMHQMFIPPLPHAKRMCIQKLAFGTVNKIYLGYSQPFWDVDFQTFNFLWDTNDNDTELQLECFAKTSFTSDWCKSITGFHVHPRLPNVLVTRISGEAAKYIETIPDDLLAMAFQELLYHFYPDNQTPKPEQLIRSRWFNEPFIRGSHTFIKIGSSMHDIKQLAVPWPNKPAKPLILFAGEGTHERFYGTVHGAYMTGIREAKRIIELY
ncbi:unnamed protein product [Rotaria magnacalcarata]|uniref:Amine oxidase domain-containing protein n=6 Tax=Rotaria magnacalcarata TaxID=392030 RepID=A0A820BEZ4_9BILA|nr:unnamed protein product [Rotaria magnacalcarata]CAF1425150.1 unnamed protein product [Rotaria magnacalcarata]CAF1976989.1 unnamed protein product [Rotaria magnacalcarata]CAF2000952.1 unnamed protein product [Rotaria magnacalcarata]CAF2148921.1 unnamed protein product [Rotaria magnacalcarata]